MKDSVQSSTIKNLRFPLSALVVFIHFNLSEGIVVRGGTYGLDNPVWYFYLITYVSNILASIAVPLFFMMSGFLFFYNCHFNYQTYKEKIGRRIWTLLIPYMLWNLIALLWHFKCYIPFLSSFYRVELMEVHFSLMRLFNTFFNNNHQGGIIVLPYGESAAINPINSPLWFVRDLMVVIVFSPVVYWLINRGGKFILASFLAIWIFGNLNVAYSEQLITAVTFFTWGGVLLSL